MRGDMRVMRYGEIYAKDARRGIKIRRAMRTSRQIHVSTAENSFPGENHARADLFFRWRGRCVSANRASSFCPCMSMVVGGRQRYGWGAGPLDVDCENAQFVPSVAGADSECP